MSFGPLQDSGPVVYPIRIEGHMRLIFACFLYKWMQAISVSNVLEHWNNSVWLTSSITALDRPGMHLTVRASVREVLQAWYFHCLAPSPARATWMQST